MLLCLDVNHARYDGRLCVLLLLPLHACCPALTPGASRVHACGQLAIPIAGGISMRVESISATGDGTGLPLGINASGPGIALLIVFSLIWALYYNSQKDLDKGADSDDSGLSL